MENVKIVQPGQELKEITLIAEKINVILLLKLSKQMEPVLSAQMVSSQIWIWSIATKKASSARVIRLRAEVYVQNVLFIQNPKITTATAVQTFAIIIL